MPLRSEMSSKSLNFFGPRTIKSGPCKIFPKLNGNHLLMTNIFNLHKYQSFGLMKSDLPIANSVCEKVLFKTNGQSEMLLFNFCLFPFSNFK